MQEGFLLGIDAGTSVVKAAIFDRQGREHAVSARPTTVLTPRPGWAEMDMQEVWDAAAATVREALAAAGIDGSAVAAVGLSGQMIGAWPINRRGEPLRHAILWNDGRTQPLIERLESEQPGILEHIFGLSGCVMQQGCTMPLVRWLADYEPETLERAWRILSCKGWLCFKLTGEAHADPGEAVVLPGDTRRQCYAEELFDILAIAQHRHLFSPLLPSEAIAGQVAPAAADETGLLPGTPVVIGAGDVPAAALGAGAMEPGSACTILGTTCINGLVVEQPHLEPINVGLLFYLPSRRWMRAFANTVGTTNLDWFATQFCGAEVAAAPSSQALFAALERLAGQSPVGSRGIIYHPYLSSAGITAPRAEPSARAQFFGLAGEHRRADLLRAVYEGVALAIRDCYSLVDRQVTEIRLSGGGARSDFWCQIIADCTGSRVLVPAGNEPGARGAALLAGVGAGWFAGVSEAADTAVDIARIYEPDRESLACYDAIYAIYRELRDVAAVAWRRRANMPTAV